MSGSEDILPTTEVAKRINLIDKGAIHKICSGQVILDLSAAVKELVENSLDSGATCIQIKLLDYGKTCITVVDNGSGIEERDFENLGLKYYTSKLTNFSDLLKVDTFGFRGEALSSLCALSNLSVITRHQTSEHGFDLQFDKSGTLIQKNLCARQVGTTVNINNIFKSLPVRAQEFDRNIKKEFSKMVKILHGYCLVSTGVKITCYNIRGNKTSTVFSTNSSKNVMDNIISVFGKKACKDLFEIKALSPDKEILEEYNLPAELIVNLSWDCYASSCCHGLGRSASDRQFFFVNNRPCDLPKIGKLINFLYHKYNNKQYPFLYLNIKLDRSCTDINVTPDKRTIFFTQEQIIFAMIKSNFDKAWKDMQGMFTIKTFIEVNDRDMKRKLTDSPEICSTSKKRFVLEYCSKDNEDNLPPSKKETLKMKLSKYKSTNTKLNTLAKESNLCKSGGESLPTTFKTLEKDSVYKTCTKHDADISFNKFLDNISVENFEDKQIDDEEFNYYLKEKSFRNTLPVVDMLISMDIIKSKMNKKKYSVKPQQKSREIEYKTNWNPAAASVDKELEKLLTKECFEKMEVIGQFNLGFILAKLKHDVFIIDQHASDEKYRFEKLSNETKLKTQKLIVPKPLSLSITNELIIIENEHIFRANGFSFAIKTNDNPGQQVKLTGIPVSYGWQFEKEDIDEIIFLIKEGGEDGTGSNVIPRPSRVRQMLASRACRSAVMIGKALNLSEMNRILMQMSQIDDPWACPHGRPTLRHLISWVSKAL